MSQFHLYLYGRDRGPLPSRFDDAQQRLVKLQGVLFEPDGSFAWTSPATNQQVFGMIYDDAVGLVQFCELQGKCSHAAWREILRAVTGPVANLELELMALPEQRLEDLQTFEERCWPLNDPPNHDRQEF